MIITFYKTDTKGRPRYYSIHDRQGNLFSEFTFTVIWGMNLNKGREKSMVFETRRQMEKKMRSILTEKVSQGYRVLYSFSRNRKYKDMFKQTVGKSRAV